MIFLRLVFLLLLSFILCSCMNRIAGTKQVVQVDGKEIHVWQIQGENAYEAFEYDPLGGFIDPLANKRNIIAIEKATGGKIDQLSLVPGAVLTRAVVVFEDSNSTKTDSNSSN